MPLLNVMVMNIIILTIILQPHSFYTHIQHMSTGVCAHLYVKCVNMCCSRRLIHNLNIRLPEAIKDDKIQWIQLKNGMVQVRPNNSEQNHMKDLFIICTKMALPVYLSLIFKKKKGLSVTKFCIEFPKQTNWESQWTT